MALLDDLVRACVKAELKQIFTEVGIQVDKVNEVRHPHLKDVTTAEWLLESGRATSELSTKHLNFSGLKWRDEMQGFATKVSIKVPSEPVEVDFCKFVSIDAFIKGYWKFLTRTPYIGWEDHTNTPENFIGFLKSKGFAGDPNYVPKVLALLPEAQQRLADVKEVIGSEPSSEGIKVISAPGSVQVGQSFKIAGTASSNNAGKILTLTVDGQFKTTGPAVAQDGKWQIDFIFNQSGNRRLRIAINDASVDLAISVISNDQPIVPPENFTINLSASVGQGGVNRPADVQAVKKRLRALGFDFIGPNDNIADTGTIQAIKLFQSIIKGRNTLSGDGRVDVAGPTHTFLQAANAPRWEEMPISGEGFINAERLDNSDDHDFGTSWMADTIKAAGKSYQSSHRNTHPEAAPLTINDVSLPHGGNTPDHAGHETGLACDIHLPRKDGKAGLSHFQNSLYDRDAMRAMLKAIRQQPLVDRNKVFFNDGDLIRDGLCVALSGHHHHVHFQLKPPQPS